MDFWSRAVEVVIEPMYGLAYVIIPVNFASLQQELDRTLAPFMRGSDNNFPREKLAFDDATDELMRLHRAKFRYASDRSVIWPLHGGGPSFELDLAKLSDHMSACGLESFEGTFNELEPDFDAFVRRFTSHDARDPSTSRYGRWLNPIGYWDWWELGGRFSGAITGDPRPATHQVISSGPSNGRALVGNIVDLFGGPRPNERAEIEANVELVESLRLARARNDRHWLPTAMALPMGSCADEDRWFDRVEWHEIRAGTRTFLGVPADADFRTLVRAAYDRFRDCAAAGVAYHF
jgi:hypothetical protein